MIRRRWPEGLAVIGVLALAAWLRFGWVGVSSYAGDEARISLDALRLTRGGEFVYIAQPSSTGVPFLPASVWMFVPPYLLSPDPLVATLYVCLLSWLTIAGVWALARRWGALPALTAALFLAASPYAVFYGRSIWQPNLLAPLSLVWAWAGWYGGTRRRRAADWALGLHGFLALFVLQVHFAGTALALGSVYLFLRWRWWRRLRPLTLGGGLALVCTLPYVYYLLTAAPQVIDSLRQVGGAEAVIDLSGLRNLIHIGLGYDWGYLALGDFDTYSRQPLTVILATVMLLGGSVWLVRTGGPMSPLLASDRPGGDVSPPADAALAEIILVWLLISPLFFLRHTTPVLPHYQLVALPALALTAGAAARLIRARAWAWGVLSATAVLAGLWTAQIAASLDRAAVERPPQSALSSILNESRAAAQALTSDRPALFFTHGDDPAISGEVAVFRVLLWGHPDARIVDGQSTLILPPTRARLMASLAPFQAWEALESAGLAEEVTAFPRRDPAPPFVMTEYDGSRAPDGFTPIDAPALADGAQLEGWRVERVSDRLRISTLWRMTALPPAATVQQFHHLYPDDDSDMTSSPPLAAADVPLSIQQWRTDDRVIVIGDFLDLEPGRYRLRVGHYTLPEIARISTADGGEGTLDLGVINPG